MRSAPRSFREYAPGSAPRSMGRGAALLANGLLFGTLAGFLLLSQIAPDLYYRSVQEDEVLEWATVWAFVFAAGAFLVAARRGRGGALPWFPLAVALFCFVVALEEISWGQRVFGYQPPSYFLAHNEQQEMNLHNVVARSLREFALQAVILGYGVALPLVERIGAGARLLRRLGISAPPLALLPAFLATFAAYALYPVKFTGEIVELLLGLGFLAAAVELARPSRVPLAMSLALATAVVAALGFANAGLSRLQRSAAPANLEAARVELEALQKDFQAEAARLGQPATRCKLHKRLYAYWRRYGATFLEHGEFQTLRSRGLPEERADFFLDPWNSPYWIRDSCSAQSWPRRIFVYSFGPNRRRESSRWELRGDDLGAVILARGAPPSETDEPGSDADGERAEPE